MSIGTKQIQIGGSNNTQVTQVVSQSFSSLLVNVAGGIKRRRFKSSEVRDHFFTRIDEILELLNVDLTETLENSKYMIFPFEAIAIPNNLHDTGYITSLLDTLSVIAFTAATFQILQDHINIKIDEKNIFGVYYTLGNLDLVDAYTRLLKSMSEKSITVPSGFVCVPLNTRGVLTSLDEGKINNIVTNIYGDPDYIKPLKNSSPKCLSLSSYIVSDAASVDQAKLYIRGVLGLD